MTEQLENQLRQALAARAAELPRGSSARLRQLDYHARTRSVHPPVAAGVLVAAGAAAATVALVGLGTNTQEAFAGWTPTPTPAQKGQLASAEAACQNRRATFPGAGGGPISAHALPKKLPPPTTIDPGTLKPALTDTRGPFTFVILAGDHGSESCITGPSFTWLSATATTGSTSVPAGQVVLSSTHMPAGDGQALSFAEGHTGSNVTGTTLTLDDGAEVKATVANGWFVAWWPGTHNVTSALVTTPSGTSTQHIESGAWKPGALSPQSSKAGPTGCLPQASGAHTVRCSGSAFGADTGGGAGANRAVQSGGFSMGTSQNTK